MAGRRGRVFVAVVAVALVLSTPISFVGVAGGTNVSAQDGSGEKAVYPGQTIEVVNVSVGSEDDLVYSSELSTGSELVPFGSINQYAFINDGSSSDYYQQGDDVVKVEGANNEIDGKERTLNKFNKSIIYKDDSVDADNGKENRYDGSDDIYSLEIISGDPYISDSGTKYSTFDDSEMFLTSEDNGKNYEAGYPIISTDNSLISSTNSILKDGSSGLLKDIPQNIEHYNDQDGTSSYDSESDSTYGEPIYDSGGDGVVDADLDTRLTSVEVFSGFDDGDISTINLDQESKVKLGEDDSDLGIELSDFETTPTVNEIDPDGSENSPEGKFGSEDIIVIDIDRDGYYDESKDILLQGNVADGTPYTTSNIEGVWRYGYDSTNNPLIVFDKGYDEDGNSDDLLIQSGSFEINTAENYTNTNPVLKYWNNDGSTSFQSARESTYFDVNEDSDVLGLEDFRVTHFVVEYESQSIVSAGEMDAGISLAQFSSSDKYIDDNRNKDLENGEAIVETYDNNLDGNDKILVRGSVSQMENQFSTSGDTITLYYGDFGFSEDVPIISLQSNYPESSDNYNTNQLSAGEVTVLNRFGSRKTSIEGYLSAYDTFIDGNEVVRLVRFEDTSGSQIDWDSQNEFELNEFFARKKFENLETGYQDGGAIVEENDGDGDQSTFGDRLTALTIQNQGTLPADAIESVTLHQNETEIASTTMSSDGAWTLEPDADGGIIPTGESATNLSVTATLAADAPTDETVDFAISAVDDGGSPGEFDAGDRGMFFADESPAGGIDSGPSYTVADASDITADAIAFRDPDLDHAPAIELAFTDDVDPASTEPGDFAIETVDDVSANVTNVADDDGDGRLLLEIESGVAPSAVESVVLADGGLTVGSGAAVPGQTLPVETTSVTIAEAQERPHVVYQDERVAVLANDGGSDAEPTEPSHDEAVRIDQDTTGDGSVDDLRRLGSTGNASLVTVLDTAESNASEYRVTFQSEDGDAGETVSFPVENLSLSASANRTNTTDVAGPIGATITASGGDRLVRAELLDAANGTELESRTTTLDGNGEGVVAFPARVANVTIAVTDLATGVANRTENVTVRKGYPGATFSREVYEEERGDIASIEIELVDTETTTVSVGSEAVNYHERITVVDRDGDGSATVELNTHLAGSNAAGTGVELAPNGNRSAPNDDVRAVRRSAPAGQELTDPLDPGNYALETTVDGDLTDVAILAVVDRATTGASTRVAPAGVDLDGPADVENWTTPRDTVAVGDTAVVAVDASGLEGYLNDSTDLRRGSPAAAQTGAYVDIRRGNPPPNRPAGRLNVSNASTIVDGEGDALFVVIPSDGDPYAIEDGEEYEATFVLNETSPYVPGDPAAGGVERESAKTAVAFESPDGRFADLDENLTLDLPASASATVAGETNVAPGTTVTITVRSDDDNVTFQETDEETVSDDGTFDGSVDLADYPEGTDYTVVASANDEDLTAVRTGTVVESPLELNAVQNLTTVAPQAGGGGGGGGNDAERTNTETNTEHATESTTTEDETGSAVRERAATFVTKEVPEFIRTQETNLVIGIGILAFVYALVGLRRLTQ